MSHIIFLLIALGSLGGIVFMLWRKIPLLLELPEKEAGIGTEVGQTIKKVARVHSAKSRKFLEAALTQTRKLAHHTARQAAKTEAQTSRLLEKFRTQSEVRKEEFKESYWDKLRKRSKK